MLVFKLNQDIVRGCAPIADKDVHSFNDSKNLSHLPRQRKQECLCHAPTLADSPETIVKMQELDNQALNQAFFASKLACVFQGPKHALQALYAKKKESLPFGCQHSSSNVVPHPVIQVPHCEEKESHLQLRVKRPTPPHTTLVQTQHQKPELCSSKNLSPPSFGNGVHHDPNIELWMPVPSLVCLQRSGQDGRLTDPGVNPW